VCTFGRDQAGHSLLLEVSTEEVARLMTALDHDLMARINPLEYIGHVFKSKGARTVNLNMFLSRFNQVSHMRTQGRWPRRPYLQGMRD
jgi:hypothetical protein